MTPQENRLETIKSMDNSLGNFDQMTNPENYTIEKEQYTKENGSKASHWVLYVYLLNGGRTPVFAVNSYIKLSKHIVDCSKLRK
jgi:hypothetical protein